MTEIVADIIKPFGPSIFKVKIPKQIVDDLNHYVDNIVANETKANQLNYGNQLIGDVTQEFKLEEDFIKQIGWLGFLGNCTSNWIQNVTGNKIKNFSIMDSWIVRQFENEYNPIHVHLGSALSCVGYLKLPEGIEKEWEEDYKDHHPSHGHIQFVHGQAANHNGSNFLVKPQVGDFFVFPAHLHHCVYPFKTKGERRSFSVNFTIVAKPKGES